jgi:hypothetical protein
MPDLCPASFSSPVTINPAPLSAGAHTVRQTATDLAGNVATSATWTLSVDRTPPVSVGTGFNAYYDSGMAGTVISWPVANDPALADGTPGSSGIVYSYQVARAGGAFSAWAESTRPVIVVPGPNNADTFTVKVVARDQVGNQAPLVTTAVSPTPVDPQAICDGSFGTDDEARQLFCHTYLQASGKGTAAASDSYGLNPLEKSFCLARPYHCQLYSNDAAQAFHWTGLYFTGKRSLSDSTRANAFQHAVWNALMVESDNSHSDYALDFSTRHEDEAYNSADQQVAYRSRMDLENNKTGNIFGQTWSPTKNDLFMCQGMLDNNRNSGINIGPTTDAISWMASNATTPRQQIWRKTNTYDGTVDGTHYPPVLVEPTTSKCS